MIQRIQSVYMLLAVVLTVACLCMQVGTFYVADLPVMSEFNLWCTDALGGRHFLTWQHALVTDSYRIPHLFPR